MSASRTWRWCLPIAGRQKKITYAYTQHTERSQLMGTIITRHKGESFNIFLSLLPFCNRRSNWVPDERPQVPSSPKAKVVMWLVLANGTWVELMHPTSESCPRKDATFPSLPSLYPLSGGWRVLGQLPWRQERKSPVKGAERLWLTSIEKIYISFPSQ